MGICLWGIVEFSWHIWIFQGAPNTDTPRGTGLEKKILCIIAMCGIRQMNAVYVPVRYIVVVLTKLVDSGFRVWGESGTGELRLSLELSFLPLRQHARVALPLASAASATMVRLFSWPCPLYVEMSFIFRSLECALTKIHGMYIW